MRMLVAAAVITVTVMSDAARPLHITVSGSFSDDHRRGFELGVAEMTQTASLLDATLSMSDEWKPFTVGQILGREMSVSHAGVPVVHLTANRSWGPSEQRCRFRVEPSPGAVTWQPSTVRYGASELNERYVKRFKQPMTSEAWNAWFAVKAIVESALRAPEGADLCDALAGARFDGHKGASLSFDPTTGVLRHPADGK